MGHRQLFFPPQTSNMECADIWDPSYPDPHSCPGTAAMGMHPVPYFDITQTSNNLPSSNISLEIQNHNFFQHPMPPNYVHGGPSCYNEFAINFPMDYERAPFKRNNPAISMAFNRGNNNNYPRARSSSTLSVSSVNSQVNPIPGPQYWAWDPNSMPPSYMNNNVLAVNEESQRNVRNRQSLAFHLGNNQSGTHPPSNIPHLHPATNISGMNAPGQWSHTPHPWILPSGAGSFGHGMNQTLAGSNNNYGSVEIDRGYHHPLLHNRIPNTQLPSPNGCPSSQIVIVDHIIYEQRTHPFRTVLLPRHSRPVPMIGQNSERNGRPRGLSNRFQPISYANSGQSGWVSDGRTFYDSRNLFDQHHDMRLDIDSLSYEELLALQERIGNVSTGLSGDDISRYIVESTYCSEDPTQNDEEEKNCVICLEAYKDEENVGRLACKHDFHSNCIKKWLLIKKACPICKGSALADAWKEK